MLGGANVTFGFQYYFSKYFNVEYMHREKLIAIKKKDLNFIYTCYHLNLNSKLYKINCNI